MGPLALLLKFSRQGFFTTDAAIVLGATEHDVALLTASGAVQFRDGVCWIQPSGSTLLKAHQAAALQAVPSRRGPA